MLNNNAFKTSLMFLGIIFTAIMVRMFLVGDTAFVQDDSSNELASITCILKNNC